jgi:hypothetical protein
MDELKTFQTLGEGGGNLGMTGQKRITVGMLAILQCEQILAQGRDDAWILQGGG